MFKKCERDNYKGSGIRFKREREKERKELKVLAQEKVVGAAN
jgi:hypothetical protein